MFRPQRVIDFFVDDARYISREIDFFPEIFHSSQLQATTLLCEGILLASKCPTEFDEIFVKDRRRSESLIADIALTIWLRQPPRRYLRLLSLLYHFVPSPESSLVCPE